MPLDNSFFEQRTWLKDLKVRFWTRQDLANFAEIVDFGNDKIIYVIEIKSTPCKSYYQDSQFYIAVFLHPSDNTFALDIRIGYPYYGSRHILLFLLINQTSMGIPFETLCIFQPIGESVQPALLASIPKYPKVRRYYQELWATSKPTPCFPVIIKQDDNKISQ